MLDQGGCLLYANRDDFDACRVAAHLSIQPMRRQRFLRRSRMWRSNGVADRERACHSRKHTCVAAGRALRAPSLRGGIAAANTGAAVREKVNQAGAGAHPARLPSVRARPPRVAKLWILRRVNGRSRLQAATAPRLAATVGGLAVFVNCKTPLVSAACHPCRLAAARAGHPGQPAGPRPSRPITPARGVKVIDSPPGEVIITAECVHLGDPDHLDISGEAPCDRY